MRARISGLLTLPMFSALRVRRRVDHLYALCAASDRDHDLLSSTVSDLLQRAHLPGHQTERQGGREVREQGRRHPDRSAGQLQGTGRGCACYGQG